MRSTTRPPFPDSRAWQRTTPGGLPPAAPAISTKAGVVLYTVEEGEVKTYTDIGRTLASMEPMDEIGFLRIHGSVVLNMAYYRGMSPTREVTLAYPIDHTIYVSVRHLPAVKRFLDRYCY